MPILSNAFNTDVSVQSSIGILLISISLALIIVGIIIFKFRILDTERLSASRITGVVMVLCGIILLAVSILGLIHVNFFML